MSYAEKEPWQKLRSNERCEACGHRGYCMYNSTKIYCMFPDGGRKAEYIGTDGAGAQYAIYLSTGQAAPIPIRTQTERADWEHPDAIACEIIYTTIAQRSANNPAPEAARDADVRRFGEHAEGVREVSDHFYIQHPENIIAWLDREGRTQEAKNAGVLTKKGTLSPALLNRKIFVYRDMHGRAKDFRGRAYDGSEPKVRCLAGSREERGAAASWYQHQRIASAAEHGGHIRIAGGHEKADALNYAVGPTVGANEGQASDGMIDALIEGGIIFATIHADSEKPRQGKTISEGQRLALALAERLEARGIAVRIAEPTREAEAPKLDADTVLRDQGPAALRDIDRAAVPLGTYRTKLGIMPDTDLAPLVTDLRRQLLQTRQERDQAKEWNRLTYAALRAGEGTTPKMKALGRAVLGLAIEWDARRAQGQAEIDPYTGERWTAINLGASGSNVGLGDGQMGAALSFLCDEGLACKRSKSIPLENPEPGQYPWKKQLYVHFEAATKEAILESFVAYRPAVAEDEPGWGGKRTPKPVCDKHPDAGTKTTVTHETACADCGAVLDRTVREEWHDATGQPMEPVIVSATMTEEEGPKPQDEASKLTYSEETHDPSEVNADPKPHLVVLPPRLSWCMNYRGVGKGCQHRVLERGDCYCPGCVAEGFSNPDKERYAEAVGD